MAPVRLSAIFKSNSWIRNNIIKRPEYWIYCVLPTEVANKTNAESSIFDDIDIAATSLDTVGLGMFVIGSLSFVGCKIQEMSSRGQLVTNGFFKYSRNPMAIACMTSMIGGCLLTHNPYFAVALPMIGFYALHFHAIPVEEANLHETFGKEYEEYTKTTNRWITLNSRKESDS